MQRKKIALIEADNPTWEDVSDGWFEGEQVLRFAQDDNFGVRAKLETATLPETVLAARKFGTLTFRVMVDEESIYQ